MHKTKNLHGIGLAVDDGAEDLGVEAAFEVIQERDLALQVILELERRKLGTLVPR